MNLDETEKETPETEPAKKLSRKEKKALKRAQKEAANAEKATGPLPESSETPQENRPDAQPDEEVDAELEPAPVPEIPPTRYSTWEKISPPARRKKQLATMESGYREVLALVHSMRENQEVLMHSFQKLPEAVDSVRKLADHSAQQSELLTAMNEQLQSGSAGKFNDTLTSMDKTTQLLLERAQRSEERLYGMLRRAQRRIAFMTLLVLMLFLGTSGAILFLAFPEQSRGWLEKQGWVAESEAPVESTENEKSTEEPEPVADEPAAESSIEASTSEEPDLQSTEEPSPLPESEDKIEKDLDEIPEQSVVEEAMPLPPPAPMDLLPTEEQDPADDSE